MYSKRQEAIRNVLVCQQLDAFFITNFYNILYFSGFKTLVPHEREAFLLVTKKNTYVFTDGRYDSQVKSQRAKVKNTAQKLKVFNFKLLTPDRGLLKHLQEIIAEEKINKMGFEKEDLKWSEYNTFQKALKVELIPQDRVGVKIRAIKEKGEIEKINQACEIGDECLSQISKLIKIGMSEKEIAWNIEKWIRQKRYEIAFDPIVAIDRNSAIPHYDTKNGSGTIKDSSIILIDMGVRYQGYNSDITRMFFMGAQPEKVIKSYKILQSVQEKTIQQIIHLQKPVHIDAYCRKQLIDKKLPSFAHSTGHGVGLEVHEYPKISLTSEDVLQTGNVFTIEPGIYLPGKWGMRIEDTVVLTFSDHLQVLTAFPKELQVL